MRLGGCLIEDLEFPVLSHNADGDVFAIQFNVTGQGVLKRLDGVLYQGIRVSARQDLRDVVLQVRLGALRPRANGHGLAADVTSTGADLKDVGTLILVPGGHQKTYTVRTPVVTLRTDLHLVAHFGDQTFGHDVGAESEFVIQALLTHVPARKAIDVIL